MTSLSDIGNSQVLIVAKNIVSAVPVKKKHFTKLRKYQNKIVIHF